MASYSTAATASSTNTDDTELIAAPGDNKFVNLSAISFSNSHASTNVTVTVKFGATAQWSFAVPAGGSHSMSFSKPVRLPENTALNFASSASVSTIYGNAAYDLHPNG